MHVVCRRRHSTAARATGGKLRRALLDVGRRSGRRRGAAFLGLVALSTTIPSIPAHAHFDGRMVVRGSDDSHSKSVSDGNRNEDACYLRAGASASISLGTFTIAVSPVPDPPPIVGCEVAEALPVGQYSVYVFDGDVYEIIDAERRVKFTDELGSIDCLRERAQDTQVSDQERDIRWRYVGSMIVDESGFGAGGPFTLTPNLLSVSSSGRTSAVCISNELPPNDHFTDEDDHEVVNDRGNQAPLQITA